MKNLETILSNVAKFERVIDYSFKNKEMAIKALTHSSYANENKNCKCDSNERLEFLGDSVLNIVISESIFKKYPDLSEGEMTKIRASIVCEQSLMKCSKSIGIDKYLLLGKGEEISGGRKRDSILADACEALIGAIYIDGGMLKAKKFIITYMNDVLNDAVKGIVFIDYKTQLQENVQKNNDKKIVYELVEEKGPDHEKHFTIAVKIDDKVFGQGEGKSKKEAEQIAAKAALENLGEW